MTRQNDHEAARIDRLLDDVLRICDAFFDEWGRIPHEDEIEVILDFEESDGETKWVN